MGAAATFIMVDALANKGDVTQKIQGAVGMKPRTDQPAAPAGPSVTSDADNENAAQKAAERRRRTYANVGRSSTILTPLGGVGSPPSSEPKMLLGL